MTRYEQLAEQIKQQIEDDIWQVGDRLPSLRESARQSGLSLMTVVQSYQLLESQGWWWPVRSPVFCRQTRPGVCPGQRWSGYAPE